MNLKLYLLLLSSISTITSLPLPKNNFTVQLCCQPSEYFNMSQYKCQPLKKNIDVIWNLKLDYLNKTEKELSIFKDVPPEVNLPCEKPEIMYWKLNEAIDINIVKNVEYCFTPFHLENTNKYVLLPLDCIWELHFLFAFRHEYIYFLSGFFLIPTAFVYIILKPLNATLMGKCFIGYLCSVIATNGLYLIIVQMLQMKYRLPNLIYILIGFDAWKNLSELGEDLSPNEKRKRFWFYSTYVWIMGALTTVPTVWRNVSVIIDYCGKYKRSKTCVSLTYIILYTDMYFAPLVMIILIINFLILCSVSWKVYNIRRKFAATMYRNRFLQENSTICLRLFLLLGPQWMVMYILKDYKHIEILITCLSYVESFLIFIIFILRKNVLKLLLEKIKIKN
ncbi:G-protein coupled receptor Mth2-like isoform X2 [Lucilia cuprina]|uniref:G-protein coupled receptor Mth2-like isoform X2 n=1 Tax=Lucilia cuprina TaxID=7375 RepID=UPI001F06F20F|nr:G-protein coupled receptor Mth2-like isoform X2 [Lucilia cuprina]